MHLLCRRVFTAAAVGALIGGLPTLPAVADDPPEATVVVDNNSFEPDFVHVARAGEVIFDVREGGHVIKADDGSFELRGPDGGTVPAGSVFEVPMPDEDMFVGYHCTVHSSMKGQIKVGHKVDPEPVIHVPEDEASLQQAVYRAGAGYTVDVAAGVYGSLEVPPSTERLTIRGRTGDPADVTISGSRDFERSGVEVTGSHITLQDLTVESGRFRGVWAHDANAVELQNVVVTPGTSAPTAVVIERTTGASLVDVTIAGHKRAVVVSDCEACGFRAQMLRSEGNETGLRIADAHGALVSHSTFVGGRHGVVLSNIGGVSIENNTVTGTSDYGIVMGAGFTTDVAVVANTATGAGLADLAWDGVGTRTCFAANTSERVEPSTLTETASCDALLPWSVPSPVVSAAVAQEGER